MLSQRALHRVRPPPRRVVAAVGRGHHLCPRFPDHPLHLLHRQSLLCLDCYAHHRNVQQRRQLLLVCLILERPGVLAGVIPLLLLHKADPLLGLGGGARCWQPLVGPLHARGGVVLTH